MARPETVACLDLESKLSRRPASTPPTGPFRSGLTTVCKNRHALLKENTTRWQWLMLRPMGHANTLDKEDSNHESSVLVHSASCLNTHMSTGRLGCILSVPRTVEELGFLVLPTTASPRAAGSVSSRPGLCGHCKHCCLLQAEQL
ncbi:hypothetical protein P7K49_032495 [Saguinus oedipus]|uniref:Uncharacterized protein n=1 Tax=Saguinus oedipus TaxID=9490 RepID=A0ABQ9TZ83_SAGOE|nr:hypothetical protein P7K49_032495 [Saguinus oedipus]